MTYLAPRQGLFAIIVFISFCLHSLLLVMNTDQTMHDSRQQKGEGMLTQLIDESVIALTNEDRVSLGVIASRYKNDDVMHLEIRDANKQILVQVGDAPLHKGTTITRQISQDDAVIGDVNMVMKQTSKGEIFKMLWPFILGSLILHTLLWFAYGFIARPTKAQLTELSRDIHEHYRTYYSTGAAAGATTVGLHVTDEEDIDQAEAGEVDDNIEDNQDSFEEVIDETIEVAIEEKTQIEIPQDDTTGVDFNTDTAAELGVTTSDPLILNDIEESVAVEESVYEVAVDIQFADKNGMMALVTDDYVTPYLDICTQLLHQAINEVVKQPNVHGVYLNNNPMFTQSGATAVLKVDSDYSKIGLAAAMLAMLYNQLNQIVYAKHRELGRFALPVKTGISYDKTEPALQTILADHIQQEQVAVMLPSNLQTQINQHIQLKALITSSTMQDEQQCTLITEADELMSTRLNNMKHAVLTANS